MLHIIPFNPTPLPHTAHWQCHLSPSTIILLPHTAYWRCHHSTSTLVRLPHTAHWQCHHSPSTIVPLPHTAYWQCHHYPSTIAPSSILHIGNATIPFSDSDSDSEYIYSATYHTITVFNYIKFQTNGPRRPPLRQNNVAGMEGHLDEISICTCLHNILHMHVHIHKNIWLVKKANNICRLHKFITNWILC